MRRLFAFTLLPFVSACTTLPHPPPPPPPPELAQVAKPVEVQILAINDFHGNLETPPPVEVTEADGSKRTIASGGAAQLGAVLKRLRGGHPNTITVAAGDLIGASPLISAYYLDEPTIHAMNRIGLALNAVGNHEFDKGSAELRRMQDGGCAKHTRRTPCAVEPFPGARFRLLAANVRTADGRTLFQPTSIAEFDGVKIGFIGVTLKETKNLVTPSGVAGLTFEDEAATANALVPQLKAQGADAIVLLIHQGGKLPQFTTGNGCDGLYGDILPILAKLDPAITTVVSGHSHWAYVCEGGAAVGGRLLTSAGKNGYFVTDVRLSFDPNTHRLIARAAQNVTIGNGEQGVSADVRAIVDRYASAVAPVASRVIGRLRAAAPRDENDGESSAADLIADAMLASANGAQIALVNATGVRIAFPAGDVRYGDAFSVMPFGNNLLVMTLTGTQLKTVLEQQYSTPPRKSGKPAALAPSAGFTYAFNYSRPAGDRIVAMALNGRPIAPAGRYRVVVNNYLASGGDNLPGFTAGTDVVDTGTIDIDALVAWIARGQTPPRPDRIRDATGS